MWGRCLSDTTPFISGRVAIRAEPGWATPLSAQAACELGTRYRQHAIYLVDEGILRVMLCDGGQQAKVGQMAERLQVC